MVVVAQQYDMRVQAEEAEYVEPLCDGDSHNGYYPTDSPFPVPPKILGFTEQDVSYGGGTGSTQEMRLRVNPGSGEVSPQYGFRAHVQWSTRGMKRCEACGAWSGGLALNGNQWITLYDDTQPVELRCTVGQSNSPEEMIIIALGLRYLPRPQAGRHVEPRS